MATKNLDIHWGIAKLDAASEWPKRLYDPFDRRLEAELIAVCPKSFDGPITLGDVYNDLAMRLGLGGPKIKRVIFSDPATIIFWTDDTKTVVKCQKNDTYDKEKGFVMAYLKKLLGNDNAFNKEIYKWVYKPEEKENKR